MGEFSARRAAREQAAAALARFYETYSLQPTFDDQRLDKRAGPDSNHSAKLKTAGRCRLWKKSTLHGVVFQKYEKTPPRTDTP